MLSKTIPMSPEFIWKIFNNRLHSLIRSSEGSNDVELLDVRLLHVRVNSYELKKHIIHKVNILFEMRNANPEKIVGYLLSLHVLQCYRRDLELVSSGVSINVDDNLLREFISSQTHRYFYLNRCIASLT